MGASGGVRAVIMTPDVDRLARFFAEVCHARTVERTPPTGPVFHVALAIGDDLLDLVADDAVETGTPGRVLIAIDVADVDAACAVVAPAGGRIDGGPTDMAWGMRVAHIVDPDGNLVNLQQAITPQPAPTGAGAG